MKSTPPRGRPRSPQTLSEDDRRTVAVWAADCAERVLGLFELEAPGDDRPREAIAGLRAFARGELRVWPTRSLAGEAHAAAREIAGKPAAVAAARAAGQAAATAHMGAHALGAAAYAAKAAGLAAPGREEAVGEELGWQIGHLSPPLGRRCASYLPWACPRPDRSDRACWPRVPSASSCASSRRRSTTSSHSDRASRR